MRMLVPGDRLYSKTRSVIAIIAFCLILGLPPFAGAEEITFRNGHRIENARIVTLTDEFISVQTGQGVMRFPIDTIESIDGKPLRVSPPVPEVMESEVAPVVVVPVEAVASEESETFPPPIPEATPAEELPVAEESAATQQLPAPAPDIDPESPIADDTVKPNWNYEFVLLCLLVGSALWMRSLQAVQRDLFHRRVEPRYWTLVALLLPIVGALAYMVTMWTQQTMAAAKARKGEKDQSAEDAAKQVGTGMPYPFGVKKMIDPAAHVGAGRRTRQGLEFLDSDRKSIEIKSSDNEFVSGLDHADELLQEALLERASDIHIEPTSDDYRVRFRLDGILHERMTYTAMDGRRLVTSLKTLAEIDIAEKRKSQDGRFRARTAGRDVDFRVATSNSIYGEKLVIRVLDHRGGVFDLTSLGMSDEMLATFQSVIHSRNGMILATGPTGSGKTSTLYAALRQVNASSLNVMTIEDPPEFELEGVTQMGVNPKAGVTYESGLRSILRQDPDIILVGEMRDAEAAEIALRAALTGHLVLSSLHTKDAIGTISRLQDMKIERYQVAAALLMVLAQRLVRVLCPECRQPYEAVGNEIESLGFNFDPGSTLYAAGGCDACHGTGFKGRTGMFELLVLDDAFRKAIGEGADESTLLTMAVERGFKSYRYDGAEKILLGITTVEEVLQAS